MARTFVIICPDAESAGEKAIEFTPDYDVRVIGPTAEVLVSRLGEVTAPQSGPFVVIATKDKIRDIPKSR